MKRNVKFKVLVMTMMLLLLSAAFSVTTYAAGKTASYTTKTYKATKTTKRVKAKYRFKQLVLKGSGTAVKRINATLKQVHRDSLKEKKFMWEAAESPYAYGAVPYEYTTDVKVTYNKNGYLSVVYGVSWYAGGSPEAYLKCLTFDLKTGKQLKIDHFLGKKAKSKVVNGYLKQVASGSYRKKALNEMKLSEFQYYLEGKNVKVFFGPYQPGGGKGPATVVLKKSTK